MLKSFTINLVLSTDQSHLQFAATTVASVSRRTKHRVHARIYVRDADLPESFQSGNLIVEFLRPRHNPSARLPDHVHPCTFDRLEIVDYATDWDRCWMLDTDQVALRDLADLYRTDFEDQWMVAIVGETNREICRKWFHHDWPVDAPAGDQLAPYFGALLNLKAMREGNFTETFMRASERWEMNEQLCASIAVNGRIKPAPETSNWLVWGQKGCNSSVRADLEWGAFTPHVIHWSMGSKPWNNSRLWGSQIWVRELTDWSELRQQLAFKEFNKEKVPVIVLHLASDGVSCGGFPEDLEDNGFGIELLRACDPKFSFAVRDSVSLVLNFFGWKPCRHAMARVISHRWAWQHFLEQSDQPYSVICDDGMALRSTESEVRDLCESMGSGAWYIDLLGGSSSCGGTTTGQEHQDLEFRSISYCINRDAAQILLDLDLTTDRALFGSRDSLQELNVGRSERPYFEEFVRVAAREQSDETLVGNCLGEPDSTYNRNTRILIGICSCDTHLEKRNAVRASWFPKETSRMTARFFVGNGSTIVGENDTVIVNAKDDYLHLPQKVMEFFRHALANFEFDWLFKCDDDTYVAIDRLADLTRAAYDYIGNEFLVERGYASGGAGYLLKRSLLEKIVAEASYPETGDEDVIFGQLSMSNHAVTHATSKLCFDSSRIPRWDNDIVTCHWVSPEKMMALHVIHGSAPEFLVEAEHPLWQDHVLLFEKGYFSRKSVADVGRWKWNEVNRELILEWFDYPSEIFSISEGSKARLVSSELENTRFCKGAPKR